MWTTILIAADAADRAGRHFLLDPRGHARQVDVAPLADDADHGQQWLPPMA